VAQDHGGGGFQVFGNDWLYLNCTFHNNKAGLSGGAIFVSNNNARGRIMSSTFISNSATDGGSIYFDRDNPDWTISDSRFSSNSVANNGGAISISKLNLNMSISDCWFDSNIAQSNASALSLAFGNAGLSVIKTHFIHNTALLSGGAIEADGMSLEIVGFYVSVQHCKHRGCSSNSLVTVQDVVIVGNEAMSSGGGISLSSLNEHIVFSNVTITENLAALQQPKIYFFLRLFTSQQLS
jgi:predicted outer membrane repeat protein